MEISNALIGPLRIILGLMGLLIVHQLVARHTIKTYTLDYLIKRFSVYGSALLLVIFVLVQAKMYDIFSIIIIFGCLVFILFLDFKNISNIKTHLGAKRHSFLISFFKSVETNPSNNQRLKENLNLFKFSKLNSYYIMVFVMGLTVFSSRFLFLKNDLYTLSSLWTKNLATIKSLNYFHWYSSTTELIGELALINFYGKITGISDEMAIHSFGLLESFGVAIVIYWLVTKSTTSKFLAPIFSIMLFAFFYTFLPLNVNLILEHNSFYLATCFLLPAMAFTVTPRLSYASFKRFFTALLLIYIALGFINFFVFLIILPLYLICALLLHSKSTRPYVLRSILAYSIAFILVLTIHYLGVTNNNQSFEAFILTNLIQVSSYTYFPQLILPIDEMMFYYLGLSIITLLLVLPLYSKKRKKWRLLLTLSVFILAYLGLYYAPISFIDKDVYYNGLTIWITILSGIFTGAIFAYLKLYIPKTVAYKLPVISVVYIAFFALSLSLNGFLNYNTRKIDELKTSVLEVYHNISNDHLPFSYAVVNQNYGQKISTSEHYFITYNNFISNYLLRDTRYQKYKTDAMYLRKNPDVIIPETIFVFITKTEEKGEQHTLVTSEEYKALVHENLNILEKRGRKVSLYFDDDYLSVYQIENKTDSSSLNDLIFKL